MHRRVWWLQPWGHKKNGKLISDQTQEWQWFYGYFSIFVLFWTIEHEVNLCIWHALLSYLHNKLFHLLSHLKYCLWEVWTESPGSIWDALLHIKGTVHSPQWLWWVWVEVDEFRELPEWMHWRRSMEVLVFSPENLSLKPHIHIFKSDETVTRLK